MHDMLHRTRPNSPIELYIFRERSVADRDIFFDRTYTVL